MTGLKPVVTAGHLKAHLAKVADETPVKILTEEGEGFRIGGCIEFALDNGGSEVCLLLDDSDDVPEAGSEDWEQEIQWVSGPADDEETEANAILPPVEEVDVVEVRGMLKEA